MTDMSFASLSPSLLARKGGAKPATQSPLVDGAVEGASARLLQDTNRLEDLGWNDLGEAHDPQPAEQVAAKVAPIRTGAPRLPRPRLAPASAPEAGREPRGERAAFTLRLDPERHLKLRLACTLAGRSAQALVTEAVDAMFAATPELEELVSRVQSRPQKEG